MMRFESKSGIVFSWAGWQKFCAAKVKCLKVLLGISVTVYALNVYYIHERSIICIFLWCWLLLMNSELPIWISFKYYSSCDLLSKNINIPHNEWKATNVMRKK